MSMNFIEPEKTEMASIDTVIETLPIQPENKRWLRSLLSENEMQDEIQPGLENFLEELAKKSNETGYSFRILFLFDHNFLPSVSDCFDKKKISCERINMIPELFTQKQDDKPVIFQTYVADILSGIKDIEKIDNYFSVTYNNKKQEVRESSSLAERICYYIKLLNLPKRTYVTGEKPSTLDDILSTLKNLEEKYSIFLITELEEINRRYPSVENFITIPLLHGVKDFITVPFLLYGNEIYRCIVDALFYISLIPRFPKALFDDKLKKIKIPQWDDKKYIHEIFFELAKASENMGIIDKVFEDIDSARIPDIFFNYILNPNRSSFGVLLEGEYSNLIEPIRSEIEYLNYWWLTATTNEKNPHQIYFERCRLFLDYLKYLAQKAPDHKAALFWKLSFLKHGSQENNNIRNVLDSIAQEKEITDSTGSSWTFPNQQKEANALYEEFIDIIAQGAAAYPVATFLSSGQIQAIDNRYNYSEYELKIFKRYCEKIELKSSEDALLIGRIWFVKFHGNPMVYSLNYDISKFAREEEFINKYIFSLFSDDEEFVCRFFSIPQEFHQKNKNANEYWALYYLACWIIKRDKNHDDSSIFKAASLLLMRERIIFPEKIVKFILSNDGFDELVNKKITSYEQTNEAYLLLCNVFVAIDENNKYLKIFESIHEPEELFSLYLVQYRYTHDKFVQQEFLDYLFTLNKQGSQFFKDNDDEIYPLDIIQVACKEGILTKQTVLNKLPGYIINCKQRKNILANRKFENHLRFFMDTNMHFTSDVDMKEKKKYQKDFITIFYERAIQETEPSCIELCTFLIFQQYYFNVWQEYTLFTDSAEQIEALKIRCGKMLRTFRSIEQEDLPEDERNLRYDCARLSVYLIKKTEKTWKALKPLIVAFRASKKPLLTKNLAIHPASILPEMIINLFNLEQKTLKELRFDMANDFIDFFTPKDRGSEKTKQQAEQYTEVEQKEKGFDPNLREPSPYWRYAYMRALADLGVKKDSKGHYFHSQLEKVFQTDPSKEVREAAMKTLKDLDANRSGITGANHKKRLYEAFWWLRYAHMLSLGKEVDGKKANDLRNKEWRR